MFKQLFIFVVVIAAVVAGYVIYQNRSEKEAGDMADSGISFICDGGDNFIAEFSPEMDSLGIVVAGETIKEVPNAGDPAILRFADGESVYTFAGEQVTVANAITGESYTCHQPFDPNNAPYNFGDGPEAINNGEVSVSSAASANIIGSWQSLDDQKSVREFRGDRTVVDYYDGKEVGDNDWTIFTAEDGITTPFPQESGVTYLRLADLDEHLYFKLNKLTPEELELTYLTGGGVLRYSYVTPVSQ